MQFPTTKNYAPINPIWGNRKGQPFLTVQWKGLTMGAAFMITVTPRKVSNIRTQAPIPIVDSTWTTQL